MKAVIRTLFAAAAVGGCFAPCRAVGEEADDVIAALDAEIAGADAGQGGTADAKPSKVAAKKAPMAVLKDENHAEATGYGEGKTKHDAKLAAFRSAIENAVGVYVDAESVMKNYEMVKDRVNTISNGDITNYETIKEGQKDGLYFIEIKALVEKKAIAPKFKDVFPDAFGRVDGDGIVSSIITAEERQKDAAELMKAALQDVNRLQNWTRLSVGKGTVKDSSKEPGKRSYSVIYTMEIDQEAYLKGFVPQFKQTLEKIQEGKSQEVTLKAEPMETKKGPTPGKHSRTHFVDPVVLSGFPGVDITGGPIGRGTGGNPTCFMYDQYKGLKRVQSDRTYNIWLLDEMSKYGVLHCTAYKVPGRALQAYWKILYGKLDSPYAISGDGKGLKIITYSKVKVSLLDENEEVVAVKDDAIPSTLLTSGAELWMQSSPNPIKELWEKTNVFDSFFVRPMFVCPNSVKSRGGIQHSAYSTKAQRRVTFTLTDAQLGAVKKVKVSFASGRK